MTEPWVNIINVPNNNIVIIKGANQYFLRIFRKSQISLSKSRKSFNFKKSYLSQFCLCY